MKLIPRLRSLPIITFLYLILAARLCVVTGKCPFIVARPFDWTAPGQLIDNNRCRCLTSLSFCHSGHSQHGQKNDLEPTFLAALENLTAVQGRDVVFTCVADNLGDYRVSSSSGGQGAGGLVQLMSIILLNSFVVWTMLLLLLLLQVAWIKSDSKAILAIHTHMVALNSRLSVTHNGHNTWKLHISHVQLNDSGSYMCQINTDPMRSQVRILSRIGTRSNQPTNHPSVVALD